MESLKRVALVSSIALGASCLRVMGAEAAPDFGANVIVMDAGAGGAGGAGNVQSQVDEIFKKQERNQFGAERYAILFKPGKYKVDLRLGFYTQVLGLGKMPDDVTIEGKLEVKAGWMGGNATCNFWRSAENLSVEPTHDRGTDVWAVSQGTALRRIHIKGNLNLWESGWSSGGFMADSKVDGRTTSGSQQQWLSRNTEWASWNGGVWNMVFVGAENSPREGWPRAAYTVVEKTPVIREKPYLFLGEDGKYAVMVPALGKETRGTTWGKGKAEGAELAIGSFYIAHPKDSAATMNAALKAGKNLLITPGVYHLEAALEVGAPGTVVLGLGYPTLIPDKGTAVMRVADVDGVKVGGLLLEAGAENSATLLEVGAAGAAANHAADPTFLYDIFARVGGANPGTADAMVTINSRDVVGDNFWLWRADHGKGTQWVPGKNANGLIVNGADVTMYGLFVEHTEGYQTLWNGNGGRLYFYQSEMPYDVPSQDAWRHEDVNGFASYKVADGVTSHEAYGVGIYSLFLRAPVLADCAIEAPDVAGVKFHHVVTIRLGGERGSGISHIVNKEGAAVIHTMKANSE